MTSRWWPSTLAGSPWPARRSFRGGWSSGSRTVWARSRSNLTGYVARHHVGIGSEGSVAHAGRPGARVNHRLTSPSPLASRVSAASSTWRRPAPHRASAVETPRHPAGSSRWQRGSPSGVRTAARSTGPEPFPCSSLRRSASVVRGYCSPASERVRGERGGLLLGAPRGWGRAAPEAARSTLRSRPCCSSSPVPALNALADILEGKPTLGSAGSSPWPSSRLRDGWDLARRSWGGHRRRRGLRPRRQQSAAGWRPRIRPSSTRAPPALVRSRRAGPTRPTLAAPAGPRDRVRRRVGPQPAVQPCDNRAGISRNALAAVGCIPLILGSVAAKAILGMLALMSTAATPESVSLA